MDLSKIIEYIENNPIEPNVMAVAPTDRFEDGERIWVVDIEVHSWRSSWNKLKPLDVDDF